MVFSYLRSWQTGKITRVMCCTDEEKARYNQQLLSIVETHIAPSFAHNPKTDDFYAACEFVIGSCAGCTIAGLIGLTVIIEQCSLVLFRAFL